jgi:hypothetical protein
VKFSETQEFTLVRQNTSPKMGKFEAYVEDHTVQFAANFTHLLSLCIYFVSLLP